MSGNLDNHRPTMLERDQSNDQFERIRSPSQSRVRGVVILIAIAILAVPILIAETPREIARWHAAAAAEKFANGDAEGAFASIDQAIQWDRNTDGLYRVRGNWKLETKDFDEAFADFDQAVKLAPKEPVNYVDRSVALQHLGKYREAVADWNTIIELNDENDFLPVKRFLVGPPGNIAVYNARAYARALANIQINEGLEDVERAIKEVERRMKEIGLSGHNYALLDTRGFLYYLNGDFEAARTDLDQAVQMAEADLILWFKAQKRMQFRVIDLRSLDREKHDLKRTVAVLRYHRGLLFKRLNESEHAAEDFQRVKSLGFEPNDQLF